MLRGLHYGGVKGNKAPGRLIRLQWGEQMKPGSAKRVEGVDKGKWDNKRGSILSGGGWVASGWVKGENEWEG